VQPQLAGGERFELLSPDTVMLSAAAADAFGLEKGDKLQLIVGQRHVALKVVDILPASAVQGIAAVTDIATAQWRLGRLGELNRIDIRLSQEKKSRGDEKSGSAPSPAGCPRLRRRGAGGGERHAVALVPGQPQRAGDDRALHRRFPGLLGAGARGGAAPLRALLCCG
jgi:hypothetical protein